MRRKLSIALAKLGVFDEVGHHVDGDSQLPCVLVGEDL